MNIKLKATVLKLEFQVGLISLAQVNKWLEQELISCADDDPILEALASAITLTQHDEIVEALNKLSLDYDSSVARILVDSILHLARNSEDELIKVAHCLEHFEHLEIDIFIDEASYFKCAIEDIEAGVYGNMSILRKEMIEYFKNKRNSLK
jgi:hypothetical protein